MAELLFESVLYQIVCKYWYVFAEKEEREQDFPFPRETTTFVGKPLL